MKQILRVTLLSLLFTSALTMLVSVIGHTTGGYDPLQVVGFEVCAGKPCYKGLVPGETDWQAVKTALETNNVKFEASDYATSAQFSIITDDWLIQIISSPDRQRVAQISWMYRQHPLNIGNFILMYGHPCRTIHTSQTPVWIASFRNLIINAYSPAISRFSPRAIVYGFSLSDFLPAGCEHLLNS